MTRGASSESWTEMVSGPLHLHLVDDEQGTPTFELVVEDVNQSMERFLNNGCEELELNAAPGERYIRTPFGQFIYISAAPENSSES